MKNRNFTEGNHYTERRNKATTCQILKAQSTRHTYLKSNESVHTSAELPSTSMPFKTASMLFSFARKEQETVNREYTQSLHAVSNMESQMRTSHGKLEVQITFVNRCPTTPQNIHLEKHVMW